MSIGGVILAIACVLALGLGGLLRWLDWIRREPPFVYRGVRVRWRDGAIPWPDWTQALDAAIDVCPAACAGLWIEITAGPVDTPTTPGGRMPDGREVAGATWAEREWPWSSPTWMIVLKQDARTPTAASSALWTEVADRLEPLRRGVGRGVGQEAHSAPLGAELKRQMAAVYHVRSALPEVRR